MCTTSLLEWQKPKATSRRRPVSLSRSLLETGTANVRDALSGTRHNAAASAERESGHF
jgi:hypothetical protein